MNSAIWFWSEPLVGYVTLTGTQMRHRDNGGSSRLEYKIMPDTNADSDGLGTWVDLKSKEWNMVMDQYGNTGDTSSDCDSDDLDGTDYTDTEY